MTDMNQLVKDFPKQLKEAIQIGENARVGKPEREIKNIVISGLGGSGIGGTIVSEIIANEAKVPVVVIKDYFIPAFVNKDTLFICCSYSGNTEETIQALEDSLQRGAMISCITSGGKIAEIANSKKLDLITIPGGMPPRACLGYSLTQLFYLLSAKGIIGDSFRKELNNSVTLLEKEQDKIISEAKKITDVLAGKIPVIYAVDGYNGVATRFRQQVNENSKMLCWHNILPEMNHNELVGWAEKYDSVAVIILRNKTDYSRTQARIEISKEVFGKYTSNIIELWSVGETHLERALYLIHVTDHVSVMLADKKNIDATEVNIINHLKGQLAKI